MGLAVRRSCVLGARNQAAESRDKRAGRSWPDAACGWSRGSRIGAHDRRTGSQTENRRTRLPDRRHELARPAGHASDHPAWHLQSQPATGNGVLLDGSVVSAFNLLASEDSL